MPRKNQKHRRIIKHKWFRIYHSGSYAWLEIDFGRIGHREFVVLIGCVDKFVNFCYNKPIY